MENSSYIEIAYLTCRVGVSKECKVNITANMGYMYVRMCVCMYVCIYVRLYLCMLYVSIRQDDRRCV